MFERFTNGARGVVTCAQEEARALKHDRVDSAHLLLGILRQEESVSRQVLEALDVTLERARAGLALTHSDMNSSSATEGNIDVLPWTPSAKRVLEAGFRESLTLGARDVTTDHLLLGLLRELDSAAAHPWEALKVEPHLIRERLLAGLDAKQSSAPAPIVASVGPFAERVLATARALAGPNREPDGYALTVAALRLNDDASLRSLLTTMLLEADTFVGLAPAVAQLQVEPAVDAIERARERFGTGDPHAAELIASAALGHSESIKRAFWLLGLKAEEVAAQLSEWRLRKFSPPLTTQRMFVFSALNLMAGVATSTLLVKAVVDQGAWWKLCLLLPVWWGHPQYGPATTVAFAALMAWLLNPVVGVLQAVSVLVDLGQADAERRSLWARTGIRLPLRDLRRVTRRFYAKARWNQQIRQSMLVSARRLFISVPPVASKHRD